jgi:tight adherence protein B
MTRIPRLFAVAAAVVAAVVAVPVAAGADGARGRIVGVDTINGTLQVLVTASGLAPGQSIDPSTVRLSIDGTVQPAKVAPVSAVSDRPRRTAVLAIDGSGSMAGRGLAGAQAAADAFLAAVPSDVEVGLVSFNEVAHVVVAPTVDRGPVSRAVKALRAHGETALYDAVALAARTADADGSGTVVLLTDGADTRSRTTLGSLVQQLRASRVTVDAVGFRTTDAQTVPLRSIADAGRGSLFAASAGAALATAFHQAAQEISAQLLVTADVAKGLANGSHTIAVSGSAAGTQISDSVFAPIGAARGQPASFITTGPRPVATGHPVSRTVLYLGLLLLLVAVSALLGTALSTVSSRERSTGVRRRLSIYTLTGKPTQEREEQSANTVLGDSAVARSAVELAGRVVSARGFEARLTRKLEAAGVPMRPAEWLILHTGVLVVTGILFALLSGGGGVATLLGLVLGGVAPWLFLAFKEGRRTTAFLERMPDTLQLMAGGLRAGHSLPQSVDAVVREGSEPIAGEFNRALIETRLGVPIEDALDGVATRMRSVDFEWVVMAIRIQRDVGGNLAEVLSTVSTTLRERARLRRQVRVLSAEGRLSAWILGLLPVAFFGYLVMLRREYVRPLWHDSIGIVMIVGMLVMLAVGALWLRKVVKVEV